MSSLSSSSSSCSFLLISTRHCCQSLPMLQSHVASPLAMWSQKALIAYFVAPLSSDQFILYLYNTWQYAPLLNKQLLPFGLARQTSSIDSGIPSVRFDVAFNGCPSVTSPRHVCVAWFLCVDDARTRCCGGCWLARPACAMYYRPRRLAAAIKAA